MPAYVNLVGDNKCLSKIIRGTVTDTIRANDTTPLVAYIDGDIGNTAVVSYCQHLVSGDTFLSSIRCCYFYSRSEDKTNVTFWCRNDDAEDVTVHINYSIITSQ